MCASSRTARRVCLLFLLLLLAVPAGADLVELKDGTVLTGTIVEETNEVLIIETESLGRVTLDQSRITYVRYDSRRGENGKQRSARRGERHFHIHDPDKNSIMFCPTSKTVGRGEVYFRDFELFILNFGLGLTDHVDVTFASLFPIGTGVYLVSGGLKAELLDRATHSIGLAIAGSATSTSGENGFGTFAVIGSIGDCDHSFNVTLHKGFDLAGDAEAGWYYILGADLRVSARTKLLFEFANSHDWILDADDDWDDDFHGLLNVGMRWFGERMAFSLTGFRPLVDDSEGFIAFPMAMFSVHW